MGSSDAKGFYVSHIPPVVEVPDWRSLFKFELVDTVERLQEISLHFHSAKNHIIACDTETTSLSVIDAKLVGVSFCYESNKTYYIPVGHKIGRNIPPEIALPIIFDMLYAADSVLFWNYRYDARILRKSGLDPMRMKHFGVDLLIWNLDTNMTWPSLKKSSLQHLGIRQQEFKDLVEDADKIDISYLSPDMVYEYAGADALCTRLNYFRWVDWYLGQHKFIVDLDNEFERVVMFLEENPTYFNLAHAQMLDKKYQEIIDDLRTKICEMAKTQFNVSSPDQLVVVLQSMGVPLYKKANKGKSDQFSTSEEDLAKFENEYPIVKLVAEYRTAVKIRSTYVVPYLEHPGETVYIKYNTTAACTGRLSSSGEGAKVKGTHLFLNTNIQNYPKPEPAYYMPEPYDGPGNVLGWKFEPVEKKQRGSVEGFKQDNIRRTIIPGKDRLVLSVDYKAEEIVVAANLSDDPAFLEPLLRNEDPHKYTAIKMMGEAGYNKEVRKVAKTCNFGLIYLGNEKTLQGKLPDKTLEECVFYKNQWDKAHYVYLNFVQRQCDSAKKNGYISSVFGRDRHVGFYYKLPNRFWHTKADGYVANMPVQGTCGDIIKLDLIKLFYGMYCKDEYKNSINFMSTVHDEINSSLDSNIEVFTKCALEKKRIMEDLPFKWKKPLEVDMSIGPDWGMLFPFEYADGAWKPKLEE
jgi:DNA polymerase I